MKLSVERRRVTFHSPALLAARTRGFGAELVHVVASVAKAPPAPMLAPVEA